MRQFKLLLMILSSMSIGASLVMIYFGLHNSGTKPAMFVSIVGLLLMFLSEVEDHERKP